MLQTEAELRQLDLQEVQRLAEDAEELQARAAVALRLARQRMNEGGGAAFQCYVPGAPAAGPAAGSGRLGGGGGPVRAGGTRAGRLASAAAERLLQLYPLLLAVAEVVLLCGAGVVERASLGLLHPPRALVLAPVAAARAVACLALLLADAAAQALAALQHRPGSLYA